MTDYVKTVLKEDLSVNSIVTVHYFEFAKDYVFEGETHNFWELLYVDKGVVDVMADTQGYQLKQGEIIFHKPNEFHNVWANGKIAPNLVVIAFECKSPAMSFFENKIMNIGDTEKNLLAAIVRESRRAFSSPLNDSSLKKLERRADPFFGSEQLIKISLEQLLISLGRKGRSIRMESRLSTTARERTYDEMLRKITVFLEQRVSENLVFDDICRSFRLSRTYLKGLFKEKTGIGVMEYYRNLKIEEAKRMIREGVFNFTEIADRLAYSSIHYFSRHFKKSTGMTPSEYARSVKVKTAEEDFSRQ